LRVYRDEPFCRGISRGQGVMMSVGDAVRGVGRTVSRAANVTTMAAGAVGGAAVNGVVGAMQGAASGVQRGVASGSHSTPAAALTLGALGVTGLVEWPLILAVGGAALVLRQLNRQSGPTAIGTPAKAAPATSNASGASEPAKKSSAPAKKQPTSRAAKAPAKRSRSGQSRGRQ
jgi:hypothetical protein